MGLLTGIILYSCPYNAIWRIKIGALWRPYILWPEWLLVLHPAILGFSWRFGQEYQPVRIHKVCLDPWLDLTLHNFQIISCVDSQAWCKHFLAIRRYLSKNHDWNWVFGAVSALDMISNISRIIPYSSVISVKTKRQSSGQQRIVHIAVLPVFLHQFFLSCPL